MNPIESLPGFYAMCAPERLNRVRIPIGVYSSLEELQDNSDQLMLLVGCSGTGRDSVLDAVLEKDNRFKRAKRITTRPNRTQGEVTRISSITFPEFAAGVEEYQIINPLFYIPNKQWYGLSLQELKELDKRPLIIEGPSDLILIKRLLPKVKLIVLLPDNFYQIERQITQRSNGTMNEEEKQRVQQTKRELSILVNRLPILIRDGLVDGVVTNDAAPIDAAEKILSIWKGAELYDVSQKLKKDIAVYLSAWSQS